MTLLPEPLLFIQGFLILFSVVELIIDLVGHFPLAINHRYHISKSGVVWAFISYPQTISMFLQTFLLPNLPKTSSSIVV
jgi:hypothetical protein